MRPVELIELDKQAHKMVIAWFLGKFEELEDSDWVDIIEGGIFELLQRIDVTDLKPPVFDKIKAVVSEYEDLNERVFEHLESIIPPYRNGAFVTEFRDYFLSPLQPNTLARRILEAAHSYSTKWEFNIIERSNPDDYEMEMIRDRLREQEIKSYQLEGSVQLATQRRYRDFINLCGQLRFQRRWANIHTVPETHVLGHELYVAILAYLFSLENNASPERCINNYFTGLFHDLPEVLTRDIISPVRSASAGIEGIIEHYEREQMKQMVHGMIPQWVGEITLYTDDPFTNVPRKGARKRDGVLVLHCDKLAAFIEADQAIANGCGSKELGEAKQDISREYGKRIDGVDFQAVYSDF